MRRVTTTRPSILRTNRMIESSNTHLQFQEQLTEQQAFVATGDWDGTLFLEGITGTGKTTAGVGRLRHLLENGVPAHEVLVIVPQRTLGLRYEAVMDASVVANGSVVTLTTFGGLARRMVDLFWPMVAADAGFGKPNERPTFLSLETAQYYMARVVGPLLDTRGYFESVAIDRHRIYSQILDNLNKAALVGFPITEIGERLKSAWTGDDAQKRIFDDVQECVSIFRQYCLDNNLLDFSLQAEIFLKRLWNSPEPRAYLVNQYQHLIVDNVEEDNPGLHDILTQWLPSCRSGLVIYDEAGGYRRFLGADEKTAYALKTVCDQQVTFTESFVESVDLRAFASEMAISLHRAPLDDLEGDPLKAVDYGNHRFHPQVIESVVAEVSRLYHDEGVLPEEIVVVAPYLSDSLRFALLNRLAAAGVPARSHRPSRALREEPAAQCLLTLVQLAHPEWGMRPTAFDVAYALMTAIDGLDLVRAQLLAQIVYRRGDGALGSFDQIKPDMQGRITYLNGNRYERLRAWLTAYTEGEREALDTFWRRLFGEVLSQEGFGFHGDYGAAEIAANLIDSARNFRQTITLPPEDKTLSQDYVEMVQSGIIADQYLLSWQLDTQQAVLLAPAYTFLMRNTPVDYQFWLNVGGHGWAERLYQPLTHPYVLRRDWTVGRKWMDDNEVEVSREALFRVTLGLIRRCRKRIYFGFSQLGEQGQEQRGPLVEALQQMLKRLSDGVEPLGEVAK